ncbi:MAG: M23 family metallopeptidase [Bacteroidales bacterium]|nr:M23 family metallopeptidase [Bacteroidales bacterium]
MKKNKKEYIKLFSFRNLKYKFIFRVQDETHLTDRIFIKAAKWKLFLLLALIFLILVGGTFYIMAFTGVRQFIPGYTDPKLGRRLYILEQKTDSLLYDSKLKDDYISNMQAILSGQIPDDLKDSIHFKKVDPATVQFTKSPEDSLLRMEMEQINDYTLSSSDLPKATIQNFTVPVFGNITNAFSLADHHLGTDFSAKPDAPIYATLDGMIVYSDWTPETGHTLIIQHSNNYISVYKHNASRLKQSGDFVKAGEVIAYIGNSGELSNGPHLHFELWYNGMPVNPELYLRFE